MNTEPSALAVVPRKPPPQHPSIFRSSNSRSAISHAVLILDAQGRILFANPDANTLLQPDGPLMEQAIAALIPTMPLQSNTCGYNLAYASFVGGEQGWQPYTVGDQLFEVRLHYANLKTAPHIVLELRKPDAHDTDHALQKLMQSAEFNSDIVYITDGEGVIKYVNRAFEQASGYHRREVQGKLLHTLAAEDATQRNAQMWATLRAGRPFHGVFLINGKNGKLLHEERHGRAFVDAQGASTHYIFNSRDVSDRERILERLQHLANHDSLTGLPNRNLLLDRLQQARAHANRNKSGFTLLLLDMDHFKAVNDQLGHAVGDALLIAMAQRLRNCVRDEDTVARLGGDEFAIILADTTNHKAAVSVLEKILQALRQPIQLGGYALSGNASLGAALYPEDRVGMQELLNAADDAMYRAKQQGGDRYHFHRAHSQPRRD